jgi:ubiquinone/menaquinone biosynthesis C-methylase UbiE
MSQEERWQVSGNAAHFYERYVRLLMEPWVRRLVDVAALKQGERVLDVACGTGFVARLAVHSVGAKGRVVGVDLNASMIEAARTAAQQEAATPIEWRTADAASLPFDNGVFDVALCQQGVQFFPDRLRALREMRRVLRLGGRLAFTVWTTIKDNPYPAALSEALARHVSPEAGSMARAPYALHDPEELHDLVVAAGFRNVHVRRMIETRTLPLPEEFIPGHLAALPIAETLARLTPTRHAALIKDMTEALRACVEGEGLTLPSGAHVVTGYAEQDARSALES